MEREELTLAEVFREADDALDLNKDGRVSVAELFKKTALAVEARFRSFMSNLPALAFIKDADRKWVWVNQRWQDLLADGHESLVGTDDDGFLPPATAAQAREIEEHVLRSGLPAAAGAGRRRLGQVGGGAARPPPGRGGGGAPARTARRGPGPTPGAGPRGASGIMQRFSRPYSA